MLKIKQTVIISMWAILFIFLGVGLFSNTSYALETCGGVDTSIIKCDEGGGSTLEDTGLWGLLMLIINILTAGIGIAGVGGIIYGAVLYTTSGGSLDQVKKARQIIMDVIIGLAMYALMYAFLNYIVPGGMFN